MPVVALTLALALAIQQGNDPGRHVYPLAPEMKCPKVEVDVSDFPESKPWGDAAKALVEGWYGKLTQLLATDGRDPLGDGKPLKGFKAPEVVKLVIKKEISAPAWASGGTITISGKWITDHPEDLGMVIHELVHVIQQYPHSDKTPGWLVEGIADYIRWWRYEPELHATSGRTKIDFTKAKYTDAYRTTGMWLAWASREYDMRLVPSLDFAMRNALDPIPVFKKATGKTPDELWSEFAATK